jgi:hypothetical protein
MVVQSKKLATNVKQSWKCDIHIIQKSIEMMASRIIKFDTKHY